MLVKYSELEFSSITATISHYLASSFSTLLLIFSRADFDGSKS